MLFLSTFCVAHTYADTKGGFEITDNTEDSSSNYTYNNGVLTIESGDVTLSTPQQTTDRIVIGTANTTGEVNVHLNGVDIQTAAGHALQIKDDATFDVNIEIPGGTKSTLDASQGNGTSGIQKFNQGLNPGTLTLYGKGELTAKGGDNGCGIGTTTGTSYVSCQNIIFKDVTINAYGKNIGAGIGNNSTDGSLNNISIIDANITAKGKTGIGSVYYITNNLSIKNSHINAWGTSLSGIGGISLMQCEINNSIVNSYASSSDSYGAGIGAGMGTGACKNLHISDSLIFAYGSFNTLGYYYAGIGSMLGDEESCSNNSISGNSLVYAASGASDCPALMGFDTSDLTGGMVFEGVVTNYTDDPLENPYTVSWNKGTIYGETTLSKDMSESLELPVTTTIDENATFKVADDSKLTIPNTMSLQNDGSLASLDSITIEEGGSITTANNFYLKDATTPSTSNYATYLTSAGVVQNYTNVPALPQNYIHGWFSNSDGTGTQIYNGKPVQLNLHNFYEVESEAYLINAPSSEHGTITLNKDYAFAGDNVSFTLTPDEGYRVGDVTATTEDGKTLQLEEAGNTYSFTMPASDVAVSATFEPIPGPEPGPEPTDTISITFTTAEGSWQGLHELTIEGEPEQIVVAPDYPEAPADKTCIGWFDEAGKQIISGQTTFSEVTGTVAARYAYTPGWHENATGWWYVYDLNDNYYTNCWALIHGFWFYFNDSGYCLEYTWGYINNVWYYFAAGGYMQTGWQYLNHTWYFLDRYTGAMKTGWQKDGVWYYLNPETGAMYNNCWAYINGAWYGFNEGGSMTQGWSWSYAYDGWFYLEPYTGVMQTGWQYIGGHWYYFYDNGLMAANTRIGTYRLGADGAWS